MSGMKDQAFGSHRRTAPPKSGKFDFAKLMPVVAEKLLGEPTSDNGREMRYGTRGSLAISTDGVFMDHELNVGGGVLDLIRREGHDPIPWLRDNNLIAADEIVGIFPYKDENGEELFQEVRFAEKTFKQRRRDGDGWDWKLKGIRLVPYGLPELLSSKGTVYIPEGPGKVEALWSLGLRATCNPMGANKWRPEFSEFLVGEDVVLLADNDKPGREHVEKSARLLKGKARSIRVVHFPELPEKGDVKDWIESGATRADVEARAEKTPEWTPSSPIELLWPAETKHQVARPWLVKNRMPLVGIGLLAARRGAGKTFVAIDLAYAVARRSHWTGQRVVEHVGTLWIAAESPGSIPLRLRGLPDEPGDWPFAYIKKCPPLLDGKGGTSEEAVEMIAATVESASAEMLARYNTRVGLVIIDTMRKVSGYAAKGENDNSQTGNVMTALSDIAQASQTFVLGIDHMGKDIERGARGGSSKEDDCDFVAYLDGLHGSGALMIEKVRDGIDDLSFLYDCQVVELGHDEDGDLVTTAHVVIGDELAGPRPKQPSKNDRLLAEAVNSLGGLPLGLDELRVAFDRLHGGSPAATKKAFERAANRPNYTKKDGKLVALGPDDM